MAFLEGLLTLHSKGSVGEREGPLARGARTVLLDHHHSLHLLLLPAWRSPTPRDHSYAGLVPNLAPRTHLTSLTTEQPSCSLPSAGQSHPLADIETGRRCWLGGGRVGRLAAGGGRPTTDDGFKPRRPLWEAGGACGASCARCSWCRSRDGKWDLDVLLLPSFPTHPCLPLQTLAGPLTEAIKAVKAFARPLVRPQIAALGRLVVRGTPGNQGTAWTSC